MRVRTLLGQEFEVKLYWARMLNILISQSCQTPRREWPFVQTLVLDRLKTFPFLKCFSCLKIKLFDRNQKTFKKHSPIQGRHFLASQQSEVYQCAAHAAQIQEMCTITNGLNCILLFPCTLVVLYVLVSSWRHRCIPSSTRLPHCTYGKAKRNSNAAFISESCATECCVVLGAAGHVDIGSQGDEDVEPEFSLITGSLRSMNVTKNSPDESSQALVERDPMHIATIQSTGGWTVECHHLLLW